MLGGKKAPHTHLVFPSLGLCIGPSKDHSNSRGRIKGGGGGALYLKVYLFHENFFFLHCQRVWCQTPKSRTLSHPHRLSLPSQTASPRDFIIVVLLHMILPCLGLLYICCALSASTTFFSVCVLLLFASLLCSLETWPAYRILSLVLC